MLFKRLLVIAVLITSFGLSACQAIDVIPEDTVWDNPSAYYGVHHDFTLAGMPSYVDESTVFRLSSEQEAALLMAIQVEQGQTKFFFTSDHALSLDRLFAYVESLMPFSFRLSLGELSYSQKDKNVLTLYSLELLPVFEETVYLSNEVDAFTQAHIQTGLSNFDTLKSIHDELILNTEYDTSILELDLTQIPSHLSFEALGLFQENTAVCSGYARAFNALAKQQGIPSLMISSEVMQHAWNLVYDGSAWKYVDVTFDDPIPDLKNKVRYTYFMLDEGTFLLDGKHHFDESTELRLNAQDYLDFATYVFGE